MKTDMRYFYCLLLFPFAAYSDALNVESISPGVSLIPPLPANLSNPGYVTIPRVLPTVSERGIENYDTNEWPYGSSKAIIKLTEEYSGYEEVTHQCTRKGRTRADCFGNRIYTNGNRAYFGSNLILKLNNGGEAKTKWCINFLNQDGVTYTINCMSEIQRQPCTFSTTAPQILINTYIAGSKEDTASVAVNWSCPQRERPHFEVLNQKYSDDCNDETEYQDAKNNAAVTIAKYRVKLGGICNGHPTDYGTNGTVNTQVFAKGEKAGTGTASFVMRVSLP